FRALGAQGDRVIARAALVAVTDDGDQAGGAAQAVSPALELTPRLGRKFGRFRWKEDALRQVGRRLRHVGLARKGCHRSALRRLRRPGGLLLIELPIRLIAPTV